MGRQSIRRQCFYVLFSVAESFSCNVFLLKSEDTFWYASERIWIHVHPCSTGMYLAANRYSQLHMLPVDMHWDLSDHWSYDCLWFCQHTEAPSVSHRKRPRSQHLSFAVALGVYLLLVPVRGSQTRHMWAQVGIQNRIHCRCCNQNFR